MKCNLKCKIQLEKSTPIISATCKNEFQTPVTWQFVERVNPTSLVLYGRELTFHCARPSMKMVGTGTVTCLWDSEDGVEIYKTDGSLKCEIGEYLSWAVGMIFSFDLLFHVRLEVSL